MEKELKQKKPSWWEIFTVFIKVGALTFGGGYAMLPIINKEAVDRRGWVTQEEIMDYYAVGQCLPGMIAINTAVFVGDKIRGKRGGIVAALGVAFPSLVIIMIIAAALTPFVNHPIVQKAFMGVRIAVAALIIQSIATMWKKGIKDIYTLIAFIIVFMLSAFTKISTVLLIIAAVVFGIVVKVFAHKGK